MNLCKEIDRVNFSNDRKFLPAELQVFQIFGVGKTPLTLSEDNL